MQKNAQTNELDVYSDEYLLEMHSNSRTLAGQAPDMIAAELARRGVKVSAPGQGTASAVRYELPDTPLRRGISKTGYIIGSLFLAAFLTQFLIHTYVGRILSIGLLVAGAIAWLLSVLNRKSEQSQVKQEEIKSQLNSLMLAAADGNVELVKQLIADGSDTNETASDGTTALMYAARNDHAEVIRLLISGGANITVKSVKGSTALEIAERFSNQNALTALRESAGEA